MRFPIWITAVAAIIGLLLVVVIANLIINPNTDLILTAGFENETISPNADGNADITRFTYELARNAEISLIFENEDGTQFIFRENEPRIPEEYSMFFSGVVEGYTLDGETFPVDLVVERRLIPDGVYTWRFVAENPDEREEVIGALVIEDADSPLPLISNFTVGSETFTPNQDGVDDRVIINILLEKEADLRVFLETDAGQELPIARRNDGARDGEAGRYTYDYEGGVDLGQDPPPDGTYTIVVIAQDDEGQRIRREEELTIELGGKPFAEISSQFVDREVIYTTQPYEERFYSDRDSVGDLIDLPDYPEAIDVSLVSVPIGDLLVFQLTVNNYSDVPIRTTAPPPGTVYDYGQIASSVGALEEPGAWRVGIQCDSTDVYPWRWAIGTDDDLITIVDEDTGREFKYLPPQSYSTVWGAIRMDEIPVQNPHTCWAGLIHEGVAVSIQNSNVDPREIFVADTASETP